MIPSVRIIKKYKKKFQTSFYPFGTRRSAHPQYIPTRSRGIACASCPGDWSHLLRRVTLAIGARRGIERREEEERKRRRRRRRRDTRPLKCRRWRLACSPLVSSVSAAPGRAPGWSSRRRVDGAAAPRDGCPHPRRRRRWQQQQHKERMRRRR